MSKRRPNISIKQKRMHLRAGRQGRVDELRSKMNKIIDELNVLGQQRMDIGNQFLEGVEVTEEMVTVLEKGTYHDANFQHQWNEFQRIQRKMNALKAEGTILANERWHLMSFSERKKLGLQKPPEPAKFVSNSAQKDNHDEIRGTGTGN